MADQAYDQLKAEIKAVSAEEYTVQHNSGTFGAAECMRAIGTGETSRGEYTVYETIGGECRVVGCDPSRAPGRARHCRETIVERRKHLATLHAQLRKLAGMV